jgi:alpha,alpha-trehalase
VLASIVWRFVQTGTEYDKQNALEVFSKLMAYHRWFINARDPDNRGVISIVHPWESGRDNCPDWDIGMQNIVIPNNLERYTRRDIYHVNSNQRPTQEQYDRFITIVNFGRKCNWDSQTIYSKGPFLMADPGVQFIFLRASRDLLAIAKYLEMDLAVDEITGWVEKVEVGSDFLWNDLVGGYCARDLRTGLFSNAITNASMLSFFADVGSLEQRKSMEAHCRRILDASPFGMPSWDPDHQAFESQRYWRGPVWAIMNHMVISGLEDAGLADLATRVRNDTINLINQQGMAEYFDPRNGDGLGGMDFSWTAAVYLDLNKTKVAASIVAAK